jgi:hypothetical protein
VMSASAKQPAGGMPNSPQIDGVPRSLVDVHEGGWVRSARHGDHVRHAPHDGNKSSLAGWRESVTACSGLDLPTHLS